MPWKQEPCVEAKCRKREKSAGRRAATLFKPAPNTKNMFVEMIQ